MTDFHVFAGATGIADSPLVRRIDSAAVMDALRKGYEDFASMPSHVIFLCIIYPVVGVVLARWSSGEDTLQLIFPLMSGFALVGPFAALGLYEISRRRELGMDATWRHALRVRRSPAMPGIVALGLFLVVLLVAWLMVANAIYAAYYGAERPATIQALVADVLSTRRGLMLAVVGNAVGFFFAVAVLSMTVVAFPLMLDRDCGAVEAIATSVRATLANPGPVALWGLIVAAALVVGSIPVFAGLAVVLPILGHATWHLYRKLVEPGALRVTRRS